MGEVGQRVAQVQQFGAQVLLARKRQQLADQTGGAVGVLVDLHQIGIVLIALIVPQQQQVAMARDRGQQVVEIMGDTPGQLADCLHLLALDELRLQRFQLGHVAQNPDQLPVCRPPGAVERQPHEGFLPVAGATQELRAGQRLPGGGLAQPVDDRAAQPLQQVRQPRPVGTGDRQEAARLLVGAKYLAGDRDAHQRHRQILDRVPGRRRRGRAGAGQHVDLAAATRARHHRDDRLAQAVNRIHPVQAPRFQRQVAEDAVERLDPPAEQPAAGLVHEQYRARGAGGQHRQGHSLGAAGLRPFAHIIGAPDEGIGPHAMDAEPQVAVARHHILARMAFGQRPRLQAEQHRAGIGEQPVEGHGHGIAGMVGRRRPGGRIAVEHLAFRVSHEAGGGVLIEQLGDGGDDTLALHPPVPEAGRSDHRQGA